MMKKITATKDIKLNAILRVYKKGYGYAKLVVIENNDYFLCALSDDEFISHVNNGDTIEAYLWVENIASYEFCLEITGKIGSSTNTLNDPKLIFFRHTEEIKRNEERKCLKAEVEISIKFFVFDTGKNDRSFSSEKVVLHDGKIIELGDREALVICNEDLGGVPFFRGHIVLNGEDFEIVGKVESVSTVNEKLYQVFFTGMSDKDRNRLLDYVFSVYREY